MMLGNLFVRIYFYARYSYVLVRIIEQNVVSLLSSGIEEPGSHARGFSAHKKQHKRNNDDMDNNGSRHEGG